MNVRIWHTVLHCVGCVGCSSWQDGGSPDEVGLRVTVAGAKDTTGAAGVWPRTLAPQSEVTIHLMFVAMSCCVLSRLDFGGNYSCLICGSVMPAI